MGSRKQHLGLALGCFCLAAAPAAAKVEFSPAAQLSATYIENVNFTGVGESDWITRLTLFLPVTRDWRGGSFRFAYSPTLERFSNSSELDHDDHNLAANLTTSGRSTSTTVGLSYALTQRQGVVSTEDPFDVLVRRVENELLRGNVGVRKQVNPRWDWSVGANGSVSRFERVQGLGSDPAGDPTDRRSYGGNVGFARSVSQRTSIGLDLARREFRVDGSPDESVDLLTFVFNRVLGAESSMVSRVGVTRRRRQPAVAGDPVTESGQVQGSLDYQRLMRTVRVIATLDHSPSLGGALSGTSTDTRAGVFLSSVDGGGNEQLLQMARGPRWSWRLGATATRRDPVGPGGDLTATGITARLGWRPTPKLSFVTAARYVEQSGGTGTVSQSSFFSASIGVGWIVRAR